MVANLPKRACSMCWAKEHDTVTYQLNAMWLCSQHWQEWANDKTSWDDLE